MTIKKLLGDQGEKLASDYLEHKGYKIIDTNVHSPFGEIDIVALHKKELVLIEVKTRTNDNFGTPEESVTPQKLERIASTGYWYIQNNKKLPSEFSIEIISIYLKDGKPIIEHITEWD